MTYGKTKIADDSFQAFLVENATFTRETEYPIIERGMIPKEPPKKIMPFDRAVNLRRDLSDTFICTYAKDVTFKRILQCPRKYLSFFSRTAGIIGFDFSVHSDMNIAKQISQINDNLSLTYYYGDNHIPVIPNIRCGTNELLDEYLNAFPERTLIAVGTHGFCKYKHEQYDWYCFLETVIARLNPTGIIVYGNLHSRLFDDLKKLVPFHFYTPWLYEHKWGKKNEY